MAFERAPSLSLALAMLFLLAACLCGVSGGRLHRNMDLQGRHRAHTPAFHWLFSFPTGLGFTLPDVQPPWLYGSYCGPTPELSVETNCRHPLDLLPIDKADEVCKLHDISYCNCERRYYAQGKRPPVSALMAMRAAAPFREAFLQSLDQKYYKCIHEADQKLLTRYETLVGEGQLPLPQWDPITRFKFFGFLEIFRRDMALDQALLELPPQNPLGLTWMQSNAGLWEDTTDQEAEGAVRQ